MTKPEKTYKGQEYWSGTTKPHTRKDGGATTLLEWKSHCAERGEILAGRDSVGAGRPPVNPKRYHPPDRCVTGDHAERALGHVIGGVGAVYDRHAFKDEKRHAFETLAAQIERIVHPVENVVAL